MKEDYKKRVFLDIAGETNEFRVLMTANTSLQAQGRPNASTNGKSDMKFHF